MEDRTNRAGTSVVSLPANLAKTDLRGAIAEALRTKLDATGERLGAYSCGPPRKGALNAPTWIYDVGYRTSAPPARVAAENAVDGATDDVDVRDVPRYSERNLDELLARRVITERAIGTLMCLHGVLGEVAFEAIRAAARSKQTTVVEVATEILAERTTAERFFG